MHAYCFSLTNPTAYDAFFFLLTVSPRKTHWNIKYNMLYIDNPVGTGFSFTNSTNGLSKNENEVADNLYKY